MEPSVPSPVLLPVAGALGRPIRRSSSLQAVENKHLVSTRIEGAQLSAEVDPVQDVASAREGIPPATATASVADTQDGTKTSARTAERVFQPPALPQNQPESEKEEDASAHSVTEMVQPVVQHHVPATWQIPQYSHAAAPQRGLTAGTYKTLTVTPTKAKRSAHRQTKTCAPSHPARAVSRKGGRKEAQGNFHELVSELLGHTIDVSLLPHAEWKRKVVGGRSARGEGQGQGRRAADRYLKRDG